MDTNPFSVLGLQEKFAVDLQDLERAYLSAVRDVHPDIHFSQSQAEGAQPATDYDASAAAVNEAYVLLKNPYKRAEWLLTQLGGPSASSVKDASPEFLSEVLELREEIETALESGGPDGAPARRLHAMLQSDRNQRLTAVGQAIEAAQIQQTSDPAPTGQSTFPTESKSAGNAPTLEELRRELNAVRYLDGLLRDLKEHRS